MEEKFDFPEYIERVTGGRGSESLLVFGSEKSCLMEAGMASAHEGLIANIEDSLKRHGMEKLDYVTLSHSHYDHIGALPYIIRRWPDVEVVAAEKTKKVFTSDGAKKTMKRLSEEAAELYGGDISDMDMGMLRVDRVVHDRDEIDLGNRRFIVIETKGHTDCSLTFLLMPESIMFLSESTGVFREGRVSAELVKSFKDGAVAAKKCMSYAPKRLIVAHHGLIPDEDVKTFFIEFLVDAEFQKRLILDAFDKAGSYEDALQAYTKKYWDEMYTDDQPKGAFTENAGYLVRNLLKEEGRL